MSRTSLTGSRIRERRQALRMKQADLARIAGISGSYLNLIEHNRRRVAGKVLVAIARALDVDVSRLTEGAEEALLEALREAAAISRRGSTELDRLEEFVSRFPGWARLVAAQRARIMTQDRTIEALNDRMTHDPFLSEALHDLISNVTAIRSSASILSDTPDLEQVWQDRFLRNIQEETARLIDGSQNLVSYFDGQLQSEDPLATPQEMLDTVLERRGYHVAELEGAGDKSAIIDKLVAESPVLSTPQARSLARDCFHNFADLAVCLPADAVVKAFREEPDPARLATLFGVPLDRMIERLGLIPAEDLGQTFGLIMSDPAGSIVFRKSLAGFPVPRFGAACGLWPLFQALSHPVTPLRHRIETPPGRKFRTWSFAAPRGVPQFDGPPILRAAMLIAADDGGADQGEPRPVGTTCRICPRRQCPGRREPSILAEE